MDDLRIPPNAIEAEQSVLGALMLDGDAWEAVSDKVVVGDFYRRDHRLIFQAIATLAARGEPRDALTVSEALKDSGELTEAGGTQYLGELVKSTASTYNVGSYAEIIRERSFLRQIIQRTYEIAEAAYSQQPSVSILESVEKRLLTIGDSLSPDETKDAMQAGAEWLATLEASFNRGSAITGAPSGFPELDKVIRGLNKKHLTLIAARPSMGKTTLMTNIVRHVLHAGGSAFLSTMEMAADDVMNQLCACHTGCSYELLQVAALGEEQVQRATGVFAAALRQWRLTIDDRGTQTVASISRGLRRHMRKHGPDVVLFVDYAQLVSDKGENETLRIGEISRGLKQLAQDADIPVILLSQLSRDCERRPDKRPMLSDLRGSGSLEQDADEVLFLYDDQVYNPHRPTPYTELIVAKNRRGRRGIVLPLLKQLDRARFLTPDRREMADDWRGLEQDRPARRAL